MVSIPDLLAVPSADDSASAILRKQEQAENDKAAGVDLQQQFVVLHSQDVSVLPDDVVLILFEFMKPADILSASQTCYLWRKLGERDELWRLKCKEAGLASILTPVNRRALERKNENSSIKYSAWKESFLKLYKNAKKFREGVAQNTTILISHHVRQMEIFNEKIVTSEFGGNLYIFCAVSGELLHTLVGHTDYVIEFQMDDQIIVSGSWDMSVKVWDVDTGSYVHTLLGHMVPVYCLKMQGNIAVSGSCDHTLRVWDVKEGRCLRTLFGHTRTVHHVQFDGNVVVSGRRDYGTIKIWDLETGECRRTMRPSSDINSLKFNGVDVVTGCIDGSIEVWDGTNGVCSHTLVGNDTQVDAIRELQGDTLVCRGGDRTNVKIWNVSTGAHFQTLAGAQKHSGDITGIQLIGKLVVTSSMDGTVKLWDLTTGEFIKDLLVLESGESVEKMKIEDAKIVCAVESNEGPKLRVLNFDNNDEN